MEMITTPAARVPRRFDDRDVRPGPAGWPGVCRDDDGIGAVRADAEDGRIDGR